MVTRNRLGTQTVDGPPTSANTPTGNPKNDNRTPNPPVAPTGVGHLELLTGVYSAYVTLTWTSPTVATDGSKMTPEFIEVWAVKSGATSWARVTTVTGTDSTVDIHGYAPGAAWQFKVRALGANYKTSAYSAVVSVVMPATGTPPLQPSAPILTSRMGVVQITWDGKAQGNVTMSPDLDNVMVQRYTSASFPPYPDLTGVAIVANLPSAGTAQDGPLPVDGHTQWFYRLVPRNILGQNGTPSQIPAGIIVQGVTAPDIPPYVIDTGNMTQKLQDDINKAIASTSGNTTPGNAIYSAAAAAGGPPYVPALAGPFNIGDLWFDMTHQNRPMRCTSGGAPGVWLDVRDAITQAAFSAAGSTLAAAYILPDTVRTQLLHATTVDANYILAGDIIAQNSVTSDAGLFGRVDAAILNTGYLSADRISAKSIVASKMLLADTENLIDEPEFDGGVTVTTGGNAGTKKPHTLPLLIFRTVTTNGPAWAPASGNGRIKSISDHPVSGAAGNSWSVYGNGQIQDVYNSRVIPMANPDEFHGEVWVRKMSQATTGHVQLLVNCKVKGSADVRKGIANYTFATSDPALTWIKITGDVVDVPGPPEVLPWPVGTYSINLMMRVYDTVTTGEVQFASPMLRRRNSASLIVDGSISTNKLSVGAVQAVNIAAGAVVAGKLDVGAVQAGNIAAGAVTANAVHAGAIDGMIITGSTIQTSASLPRLAMFATAGVAGDGGYIDWTNAAGTSLFRLNAASGTMYWRSDTSGSRWQLDGNGFRLWNAAGQQTAYLNANDGSIALTGAVTAGGTITGANIQTNSGSGERIEMSTTALTLYNYQNLPVFQLIQTGSANNVMLTNKPGRTGDFSKGWVLNDSGLFFYNGTIMTVGLYAVQAGGGNTVAQFTGRLIASTIEAGKIDADTTITGSTIIGSTIQTSASTHPMVQMNSQFFRMTNSGGTSQIMFGVAGSNKGNVHIDSGATQYPRFILDETDGITFYGTSVSDVQFKVDSNGNTTMTGAFIKTGTSGARIIMDPTYGLRAYDSTGANVFYATMGGDAYFNGLISGSTMQSTNITGGTITSTTVNTIHLNTSTINGATFTGTQSGGTFSGPTISGGGFGGTISNGGTISGGVFRSGGGSGRLQITSADQIQVFYNNSVAGIIEADGSGIALILRGVTSGGETVLGDNNQFFITNTGHVFAPAAVGDSISGGSLMSLSASGWVGVIASSRRYKQRIIPLPLHPGFLTIEPSSWQDKPNGASMDQRLGTPHNKRFTGFVAENLHDSGLTDTVIYDIHRRPDSLHVQSILAHTVRYTQWLVARVDELSARVAELEAAA